MTDLTSGKINKLFNIHLPPSEKKNQNGQKTPIGNEIKLQDFEARLAKTGIRLNDRRLKSMNDWIKNWTEKNIQNNTPTNMITRDEFHEMVKDSHELIIKALCGGLIIPDFSGFTNQLTDIYKNVLNTITEKAKVDPNAAGHNAAYIPQLDNVDSSYWGISVCTVDGQRFNYGVTDVPFTVQSTSKAISYAIALSNYGSDRVHEHIGQEPSGRLFNDISLDRKGRPWNPMINAGAIMCISLIEPQLQIGDRFDFIVNNFKKAAGNEYLGFDASIFLSERESADRNNCLAYFMKEDGCYKPKKTKPVVDDKGNAVLDDKGEPKMECHKNKKGEVIFGQSESKFKESLELYFQICSQTTTAESSSVIAGTLANGGECPTTGEKVFEPDQIKHVLSLMSTCGMYDYSGEFAFSVGVPAKSGVGGSLLIVIPNLMGICCYSPPLDEIGNSVKGVEFATQLVKEFPFHNFDNKDTCGKPDPKIPLAEGLHNDLSEVLFAAQLGDLSTIREYVTKGFDFNTADYDNRTALHLLAAGGHINCMQQVIYHSKFDADNKDYYVDFEKKDRWGKTPLDEAVENQQERTAKLLRILSAKLKNGVKPTRKV